MYPRRPEANPDIFGHDVAERILWHAWHENRLAHAWLICGARGIGKATLACRFARFVLATDSGRPRERMSESPLFVSPYHPTFCQMAAGCHSDFRFIERSRNEESGHGKTHLLIGNIKDLIRFLSLTPATGGWKIAVIDDAETMNSSASNALLKVLEEPAPQSLIFLVSHSPGRLLPTIRSRCSILTLRSLTESQIRFFLEKNFNFFSHKEKLILSNLSEGSIGQALVLAENNGVALYRSMLDVLDRIPHLHGAALYALSDRVAHADSRLFEIFGELLRAWLMRVVRCGVTGRPAVEVIPGETSLASRLNIPMRLDQWVDVWEKVGSLFNKAESLNLDRRQVVISALYQVAKLAQSSDKI